MCQGYKGIIGIFEAFQGDLAGFLEKRKLWQRFQAARATVQMLRWLQHGSLRYGSLHYIIGSGARSRAKGKKSCEKLS